MRDGVCATHTTTTFYPPFAGDLFSVDVFFKQEFK